MDKNLVMKKMTELQELRQRVEVLGEEMARMMPTEIQEDTPWDLAFTWDQVVTSSKKAASSLADCERLLQQVQRFKREQELEEFLTLEDELGL